MHTESLRLGKEVVSKEQFLRGKVVAFYFSAHWCPPCRTFTPRFASWYKNFKATSPHADEFEVVFCSADNSSAEFENYYATMPWPAVDWANKGHALQSLSGHATYIPALVLFGKDGKLITSNARGIPTADPEGKAFPWKEPRFHGSSPGGQIFRTISTLAFYAALFFFIRYLLF